MDTVKINKLSYTDTYDITSLLGEYVKTLNNYILFNDAQ